MSLPFCVYRLTSKNWATQMLIRRPKATAGHATVLIRLKVNNAVTHARVYGKHIRTKDGPLMTMMQLNSARWNTTRISLRYKLMKGVR